MKNSKNNRIGASVERRHCPEPKGGFLPKAATPAI
jgi:hypothetical protein